MTASRPVKFEVLLTDGAEQDLESIHDYIAEFDGAANANYVLNQMTEVVNSLSIFPERGSYPRELVALGITGKRGVTDLVIDQTLPLDVGLRVDAAQLGVGDERFE